MGGAAVAWWGVRLDLPEGLLTGRAATDHLSRAAEALTARP